MSTLSSSSQLGPRRERIEYRSNVLHRKKAALNIHRYEQCVLTIYAWHLKTQCISRDGSDMVKFCCNTRALIRGYALCGTAILKSLAEHADCKLLQFRSAKPISRPQDASSFANHRLCYQETPDVKKKESVTGCMEQVGALFLGKSSLFANKVLENQQYSVAEDLDPCTT